MLGDHRPTQLLQDLCALLPLEEPEGKILQANFLKRLPVAVSDHILAANIRHQCDGRLGRRPAQSAYRHGQSHRRGY